MAAQPAHYTQVLSGPKRLSFTVELVLCAKPEIKMGLALVLVVDAPKLAAAEALTSGRGSVTELKESNSDGVLRCDHQKLDTAFDVQETSHSAVHNAASKAAKDVEAATKLCGFRLLAKRRTSDRPRRSNSTPNSR